MNEINSNGRQHIIAEHIAAVRKRIESAALRRGRDPGEVKLIAVTKNFSAEAIRVAYACGIRDFGENRVQEAIHKVQDIGDIRDNIRLHLVGHLQSNKVKDAIEIFDIIHSVDSIHLAGEISRRVSHDLPVLIEVNVAGEETKYGLKPADLEQVVASIRELPNIVINGLMTVAPYVTDPEEVRPVFRELKRLNNQFGFKQLSMGMTDDFEVAIEEGSTMIRIGRAIFGERRY